jgi:hypothetical protein
MAAFIGRVRRVVRTSDNVVVDLGRRVRCFTGATREAARLQAAIQRLGRCIWPGCRLATCQIDHATSWAHGGATNLPNALLMCGHHNRYKTRGYTTRRDTTGRWHLHRPDGTTIQAA